MLRRNSIPQTPHPICFTLNLKSQNPIPETSNPEPETQAKTLLDDKGSTTFVLRREDGWEKAGEVLAVVSLSDWFSPSRPQI